MRIHVKPLTAAAGNCPVHPRSTSVLHPTQLCSSVRSTFNRVERIGGVTASCLRGISQIFLAENALSGLLILAGIALGSPRLAAGAVLGVAVETLTASVLRLEGVSRGLYGYNGALVGAAVAASGAPVGSAVAFTIVGALATIPVQAALTRIEAIPVLTAPFCCVAGLLLGPLHGTWASAEPVASPEPVTSTQWVTGLTSGILRGFSEVVLADGLLAGVLIIVGLAVASRSICGFALLGGIAGLCASALLHPDMHALSTGLLIYPSILVAIAIGAVFWDSKSLAIRVCGCLAGVALAVVVQAGMTYLPVPVYTWPFVIAVWIILSLSRRRNTLTK